MSQLQVSVHASRDGSPPPRGLRRSVLSAAAIAMLQIATPALANPVSVTTKLDRSTTQVADPIEMTVTVTAPVNVAVKLPETPQSIGTFEVVGVRESLDIPVDDGRQWTRCYRLEAIKSGEQTIPAVEISYVDRRSASAQTGIVTSDPKTVTVSSSLEGPEDPAKFRDVKNVVFLDEMPRESSVWMTWAVCGTLGALAIVALVLARRRDCKRTPRQRALRSLDELTESDLVSRSNSDGVYVALTGILRRFVDDEYDISAPRLTTSEFLRQLKGDRRLSDSMRTYLREFLLSADMVKFARLTASEDVMRDAIGAARSFVNETGTTATPSPKENERKQLLRLKKEATA